MTPPEYARRTAAARRRLAKLLDPEDLYAPFMP